VVYIDIQDEKKVINQCLFDKNFNLIVLKEVLLKQQRLLNTFFRHIKSNNAGTANVKKLSKMKGILLPLPVDN
jgi:hypothetical protein